MSRLNLVLFEPEIPHNTGAIARTCVASRTHLHLIKPLGFSLEDKWVKRTSMDYWHFLSYSVYENYQDFLEKNPNARIFYATTKAKKIHSEVSFKEGDFLVLGKESKGIPEEILLANEKNCFRIPMWGEIRSLNLSNAAAILIYEAYRQLGYADLNTQGDLHHLSWSQAETEE